MPETERRADDGVERSLGQFVGAWRLLCGAAPARRVATLPGLELAFTGLPIAFFNAAVVTQRDLSAADLAERARAALGWAGELGVPWMFLVTHERLRAGTDAAAVLDGCGLGPMMALTGMRATELAPPARSPAELALSIPSDDAGCAAILDVNAVAYGADLEASKALYGRRAFWSEHFPVLGRVDGQPASSAAVLMVDGCRYVALVASDPARQRRGYAEAAMRHALERAAAARGPCASFLHATDAGRPIYARMGYATVSTHTAFLEKRYLTGH